MTEKYESRSERRRKQAANKKKQRKKKGLLKKIALLIVFLFIACLAIGGGTFAYYIKDAPKLDKTLLVDPIASELLDKDGNVFMTLGTEKRDFVEYDDIPSLVKDAVLATEDIRFFKHHGIDFRRLAGAALANVSRGFGSEGGSTLSQQVVKRSFLSDEKTLKRKAQEAWLSIQLEKNYTKEQIFEMYVNKIYYSNGIHGIDTAANYYFRKSLDELELYEVAFLAGVPQSPNNYNPYEYPERADKRKNIVLSLMHQHGKISEDEMEKAKKISVTETLIPEEENKKDTYKYDAFVDQVIREVEKFGDYNIFADGLKVYTTLDPKTQEYTEKMLLTNEVVQYPDEDFQAGIVLLDTKSGEIRAIGGNRKQESKRQRNFATQLSDKHPGSTLKPIFGYGPAIEYLSWSTYEQIVDEPYTYTGGTPINNFDNSHLGQMSIREALYRSRNIPALKAFQAAGKDKVREFAKKLGFEDIEPLESDAIGGGNHNVSPLTLAGAFATFGNNGIYNEPHAVKKIVLLDGETEVKNSIEPKVAMKDSTAYMVTDMLKDVLSGKPGATGGAAAIPGLPIAGKTGTTNYSSEEKSKWNIPDAGVPDSWFAGYTTNYSIAVWTGYEEKKKPILKDQTRISRQLFKSLMQYASADVKTPDFKMPNSVVRVPVEKGSNPAKKPSKHTPESNIVHELFIRGTEPTEVSQTYDQFDAPQVSGKYDAEAEKVVFSWNHPQVGEDDFQFDVKIKLASGKTESLGQTKETSYSISNVEPGETYTATVIAILDSKKSSAATASVTVPSIEDEDEDEEEENAEDEEDVEEDTEEEEINDENENSNQQEEHPAEPVDGNDSENENGNGNQNNGNDLSNENEGSEEPEPTSDEQETPQGRREE